jgi:hypothetical protein
MKLGIVEKALKSYPKPVRVLARRYDTLLRKMNRDRVALGKLGDQIAFRSMWGSK